MEFLMKKKEEEPSINQPEKSHLENNGEKPPEFDVHGTALNVLS